MSAEKPSSQGKARRLGRWLCGGLALLALVFVVVGAALALRFSTDRVVGYDDPVEHFKYGSTGGERNLGFPLRVFEVLPKVCARHLPGDGYASLGFVFEPGHTLPVGMSRRRHLGIDRVFLNCAACHTSTVRTHAEELPRVVVGMPAARLNLMGFEKFMQACVNDADFTPERMIPEMDAQGGRLSLLDRYVVYPLAIYLMKDRTGTLLHRLRFFHDQPDWGPGRVDTFNSAKALFHFPFEELPREELIGTADFPSIWLQGPRQTMQLHWDGNNDRVEERNLNAAFGTGATPPTIDHAAIERIQEWLWELEPPAFPFPVDESLAAQGKVIYGRYCADCHGQDGRTFSGPRVGQVVPLEEIGTDRWRLDSFTPQLSVNLGAVYAGTKYRFRHFRKTWGYANMPLDGLWLRAPYLHNGSVPNLWALLQPQEQRPQGFYRGNDLYQPRLMGFVSDVAQEGDRRYFHYDTRQPGNGRQGHSGVAYGTQLPEGEKWALIEYLKTF